MSEDLSNVPTLEEFSTAASPKYKTAHTDASLSYGPGGIRGDDMFEAKPIAERAPLTDKELGQAELARHQSYGADGIYGPQF